MEVGPLLIGKEQVRFPDGVQHGWVQVQRVIGVFIVGQPGVIPLLPQEDVDPVVLQPGNKGNRWALVSMRAPKGLVGFHFHLLTKTMGMISDIFYLRSAMGDK